MLHVTCDMYIEQNYAGNQCHSNPLLREGVWLYLIRVSVGLHYSSWEKASAERTLGDPSTQAYAPSEALNFGSTWELPLQHGSCLKASEVGPSVR